MEKVMDIKEKLRLLQTAYQEKKATQIDIFSGPVDAFGRNESLVLWMDENHFICCSAHRFSLKNNLYVERIENIKTICPIPDNAQPKYSWIDVDENIAKELIRIHEERLATATKHLEIIDKKELERRTEMEKVIKKYKIAIRDMREAYRLDLDNLKEEQKKISQNIFIKHLQK